MKRCFRIVEKQKESIRDMLNKKYGPLKSEDSVLVNSATCTACGYSHRAACAFTKGDKVFDPEWKGDHTDKELESMDFIKRGSKTINNIEDAKIAAKNFADYVS